jgi:hypothetical protein
MDFFQIYEAIFHHLRDAIAQFEKTLTEATMAVEKQGNIGDQNLWQG